MPFPFTFTFSLIVPGLSNPFSAPPLYPYQQNQRNEAGPSTTRARGRSKFVEQEDGLNISNTPNHMNSRRRVSPSPVGAGNSRKRGWEPAFAAEPSLAPTFVTVSNGYLDTPAKLAVAKQTENGLHGKFLTSHCAFRCLDVLFLRVFLLTSVRGGVFSCCFLAAEEIMPPAVLSISSGARHPINFHHAKRQLRFPLDIKARPFTRCGFR